MRTPFRSSDIIKTIALASMIFDHAGYALVGISPMCQMLGRLAFPLFVHEIAVGMQRTSNRSRYAFRLLLLAVFSQPIYSIFLFRDPWVPYLNTIWTFFFAVCVSRFFERSFILPMLDEKTDSVTRTLKLFTASICFTVCLMISSKADYGICGMLSTVMCIIIAQRQPVFLPLAVGACGYISNITAGFPFAFMALMAGIVVAVAEEVERNEPESSPRTEFFPSYAFYVIYPVHLFILKAISLLRYAW